MTNLQKLNVSLTKHGMHKLAVLLAKYDKDSVLDHVRGSEPGINIEESQAKKVLAANKGGSVPEFWNEARQSADVLEALLLVAIVFSHHDLIDAMKGSTHRGPFVGRIKRDVVPQEKVYMNLKGNIEQLNFTTVSSPEYFDYDLHKIFSIGGLNKLVYQLLSEKLIAAGWDQKNSVIEEAVFHGFHDVLGATKEQFTTWLTGGSPFADTLTDAAFFFGADDLPASRPFTFKPGHKKKKVGKVGKTSSPGGVSAELIHNEIQNELFEVLEKKFGKGNVGTEGETGDGTSIDLVVKNGPSYWFYEIKTADSAKGCIRQAIPQLLEYAYWNGKAGLAEKLIIVSPLTITNGAQKYLKFLRSAFGLPLTYEQFIPSRSKPSK